MPQGWTRLTLTVRGPQPPILVKYSANASSYEIYLTDLAHIWSETLNRRKIIKRAFTDDTSVDPSEDAEQFQALLQKIKDALYGLKGSEVTVNGAASGGQTLELITTTKLPAPLQPLQWKFHLTRCPQHALTRHVVLPLLREERARESYLRGLMDRLKEKDWALGKLFDKIESVGLDLGTVFPTTAGLRSAHKAMTFSQAAKSIKGVAAFDESAWRAEAEAKDHHEDADNLSLSAAHLDLESLEAASDNWWEHLDTRHSTAEQKGSSSSIKPLQKPVQEASQGSDDEFQRQETPPRLKQTTRDSRSSLPADTDEPMGQGDAGHSETASDDEPAARASTASTQSSHRVKSRSKPIGAIGGKKKAKEEVPSNRSTASTASGSESPPPAATMPDAGDSTASEDETAASPDRKLHAEATEKKSSAEDKPKRQRAGGLGMIGGGKKSKDKQPSRDPSPPSQSRNMSEDEGRSPPRVSPKKPKRAGKLGVIGKKSGNKDGGVKDLPSRNSKASSTARNDAEEDDDLDEEPVPKARASKSASRTTNPPKDEPSSSPEPPRKKPPPQPEKEETAAEKANRRREELKRQLESKEKAPTKKKRKF